MIRIVNTTGRADGTQVLDAATGEDLTARLRITKIEIVLDVSNHPIAILHCIAPEIDLTGVQATVAQPEHIVE